MPAKGDSMSLSGIVVCVLCLFLLGLFLMGYLKNCFQTMDGEEPQFSAYGQESRKLLNFLAAYVIFFVITALGFALLIIPGIYLSLRLQFYLASMVDENTGIIESLKRSWEITKGYSLELFILSLIIVLISLIGTIALFIGVFVAIPLIALMYGCAFRKLTTPTIK